ncbi:islet cell autoantigen 1 [Protopterus annectens]|uniref:islet cell autoantigen 1 n=1 Tax=Protopterus annectens TaxID=7888 RepID=UPI001CF94A7A|nr:islet cell autoantigen 1 [Protopterus annectens]
MALLNDILSTSSLEEGDFSKEWKAAFGDDLLSTVSMSSISEPSQESSSSGFLPSQLLDQNMNDLQSSFDSWAASGVSTPSVSQPAPQSSSQNQNASKMPARDVQKNTKDLSAWFNLFADLDPLSNPDAVGRTDRDHELLNA